MRIYIAAKINQMPFKSKYNKVQLTRQLRLWHSYTTVQTSRSSKPWTPRLALLFAFGSRVRRRDNVLLSTLDIYTFGVLLASIFGWKLLW